MDRSDVDLRSRVLQQLEYTPDIERAAWDAPGVRHVDNALRVHPHAH
jgi:hypothetical protein